MAKTSDYPVNTSQDSTDMIRVVKASGSSRTRRETRATLGYSVVPWVDIREYGAVAGDDSTAVRAANVTAIQNAATAAGSTGVMYIPPGLFYITSTSGNYAITVACAIKGEGPNISKIVNSGTGSALKLVGSASDLYYMRYQGFSVVGNASSEDGISLNPSGVSLGEVSYSQFLNVDSVGHGRHGLFHRASWATKYDSCKFYNNGGLGVYLYPEASELYYHNNIIFQNCESRWNGGTGNAGADYLKGGVRASGGIAGFYWIGGVVESNNAWGFILGHDTASTARVMIIEKTYFEENPKSTAASTIGGNIRVAEKYDRIEVSKCWGTYGAVLGATGYCFYLANASENNTYFKEWGNYITDVGAGTNVRDYGLTYDWTRPYVTNVLAAGTHTILTVNGTGQWIVRGVIHIKWQGYDHDGVYPFAATYDSGAGGLIAKLGSSLIAYGGTAPTFQWSGGDLQVIFAAEHYGFVEMTLGTESSPPDVFSIPTGAIWNNDIVKRAK